MSLAAIPALWWMQGSTEFSSGAYVSAPRSSQYSLVSTHDFTAIAVLRGLTGIAEGSVMAICLAVVAASRQRERNFALWAMGQLALGAIACSYCRESLPITAHRTLYRISTVNGSRTADGAMATRLPSACANALVGRPAVTAGTAAALAAVLTFISRSVACGPT